jgi:hypothetical protein
VEIRRNREGVRESDRGRMPARNDLLRISKISHLCIFHLRYSHNCAQDYESE